MRYEQVSTHCIKASGATAGVSQEDYARALAETVPALATIAGWFETDAQAFLRYPGKSDDLAALSRVADGMRQRFSKVAIVGIGGAQGTANTFGGGGGGMGGGSPQMPANSDPNGGDTNGNGVLAQSQQQTASLIDEIQILQSVRGQGNGRGFRQNAGFVATPEWTKVGGLSLPIDIPVTEQSLSFSRVGGEPKLALKIRSRELVDTGVGFVWTLVWLGIAVTLIVVFRRVSSARELLHPAAWILFVGGLACFLVLPGFYTGLGFLAFLLGLLALASRFVRSGRTA